MRLRPIWLPWLLPGIAGCGARSGVASADATVVPPDGGTHGTSSSVVFVDSGKPAIDAAVSATDAGVMPDEMDGGGLATVCGVRDTPVGYAECGVGACRSRVALCSGHELCVPLMPAPEQCNGIDDDCDGMNDEGLGLSPREILDLRTDESSTGDCSTCRWAMRTAAWRSGQQVHALWRLGFDGAAPKPNVILGGWSATAGVRTPQVLFETNVTQGFQIAVSPDRIAVTACARFGSRDRPAAFWLDESGHLLDGPNRLTEDLAVTCNESPPGVIWTGTHFLFGWYAQGQMIQATYDAAGTPIRQTTLAELGTQSLPPRFGLSGERVLVVMQQTFQKPVIYRLLDLEGNLLSEQQELSAANEKQDWREARIAPTRDGWLVIGEDHTLEALRMARISRQGELLQAATSIQEGGLPYGFDLATATPGASHLLAGSIRTPVPSYRRFVRRLNDEGAVLDEWTSESSMSNYFNGPFLLSSDGVDYVFFAEPAINDEANAVRMMRIGCAQ